MSKAFFSTLHETHPALFCSTIALEMMPQPARLLTGLALLSAVAVICGMPFWFAGAGLHAYFTGDDAMNLYGYWAKPWRDLLIANVAYWSPFYRPLGGLFYRSMFAVFGFNPLPFRVACFAIFLINLALLYATARKLTGSREVGLLTALVGSYHAGFEDFYYNTGMIYDLLCFSFYAGALLLYAHARREGRRLRWPQAVCVVALYVCALNSKEMAVTLPAAVLLYELIYHRPRFTKGDLWRWLVGEARLAWLLAAMTVPFLFAKLSQASAFWGVSDYKLHVSLARYLGTYAHYLNNAFYQRIPWFTPARALLLWGAMLLIAAVSRRKALWFSFFFVLLSVLPVIFITPRGGISILYVPFLGWSLYAATLLVWVRDGAGAALVRLAPRPAVSAITFAAAAVGLFLVHRANTFPAFVDPMLRHTAEEIHRLAPELPAKSRVLFLDDPFDKDDWSPLFLVRLGYGDKTIEVARVKRMSRRPDPDEIRSYNLVLTYQNNRLVRAEPATPP